MGYTFNCSKCNVEVHIQADKKPEENDVCFKCFLKPNKETKDLTRSQLIGIIGSLRGELSSVILADGKLESYDINNINTLLALSDFSFSDEDLIDGWLDNSWQDDSLGPI